MTKNKNVIWKIVPYDPGLWSRGYTCDGYSCDVRVFDKKEFFRAEVIVLQGDGLEMAEISNRFFSGRDGPKLMSRCMKICELIVESDRVLSEKIRNVE